MEQPSASSLRGLLLDDRYQLEQVRDGYESQAGPSVALWRAVDVSLDRYVAVLVAATRTKRAARAVAAAASRASRINDGRCVLCCRRTNGSGYVLLVVNRASRAATPSAFGSPPAV